MSATTTDPITETPPPPPPTEGETTPEEEVAKKAESFIKVIGRKIRMGWKRSKAFFVRSGKKAGHGIAVAAKFGWKWTKKGAWWVAYGGAGALALVGWLLYHGVRLLGLGLAYGLVYLALAIVWLFTGIVFLVEHVIYLLVHIVQFIALLLCSPFIAMKSTEALREDWEILFTGFIPRNWHILNPTALAAQTMREREAKQRVRDAAADGQAPRAASAKPGAEQGKGRPTAKRATARPTKLPHPGAQPA